MLISLKPGLLYIPIVPCFAHILDLKKSLKSLGMTYSVEKEDSAQTETDDDIESVGNLIKKCRRLVSFYQMLRRISKLHSSIKRVFSLCKNEHYDVRGLTDSELTLLDDMIEALQVFDKITNIIGSENYCTRSLIIPCILLIKKMVIWINFMRF